MIRKFFLPYDLKFFDRGEGCKDQGKLGLINVKVHETL